MVNTFPNQPFTMENLHGTLDGLRNHTQQDGNKEYNGVAWVLVPDLKDRPDWLKQRLLVIFKEEPIELVGYVTNRDESYPIRIFLVPHNCWHMTLEWFYFRARDLANELDLNTLIFSYGKTLGGTGTDMPKGMEYGEISVDNINQSFRAAYVDKNALFELAGARNLFAK